MPKHILISALGEHPAVVTAMVHALREYEGVHIDSLHVLYPQHSGKYIGREGIGLILSHLKGVCKVNPEPLDFPVPNSTETSIAFLQRVTALMEQYQDSSRYRVYLSLAGGRKNTSALMALTSQFFTSVQGLYHLVDLREGTDRPTFPSIEEMELDMKREDVAAAMSPPMENVSLVPIPYPGAFAASSKLWQFLKDDSAAAPLPLSPAAEQFFGAVLTGDQPYHRLQLFLSQTAYQQYKERAGTDFAANFLTCFQQMQNPVRLKDRIHGTFDDFHFYKRPRTRERPFFYTKPNPIHLYPDKEVTQVVVCGLALEQENGQYKPTADQLLATAERHPYKELSDLQTRKGVLLVPLGKSPMVATQTYTLLQEREGVDISTVAVLYPRRNTRIDDAVRMLRRLFKRKGVAFKKYPIPSLKDIDSGPACQTYWEALTETIETLQREYADEEIVLSLSGGRKGMSVLAFFAAQRAGIDRVYHTLITDTALEKKVEEETAVKPLEGLSRDDDRIDRLFLNAYPREHFVLFPIPVIPLQSTPQ